MTLTLSRPSDCEWQLTVSMGRDADGESILGGPQSEADEERLAELLAQFASFLLRQPAPETSNQQIESSAVCFL